MPGYEIRIAYGLIAKAMKWVGFDGLTMPWRVVYILPESYLDGPLIIHELVHIAQIKRMGAIRFTLRYVFEMIWYGYNKSPLEIEARAAQDRALRVKYQWR